MTAIYLSIFRRIFPSLTMEKRCLIHTAFPYSVHLSCDLRGLTSSREKYLLRLCVSENTFNVIALTSSSLCLVCVNFVNAHAFSVRYLLLCYATSTRVARKASAPTNLLLKYTQHISRLKAPHQHHLPRPPRRRKCSPLIIVK